MCVYICGYSVTCFLAFGLMQFLECPTLKKSPSPSGLISMSQRSEGTTKLLPFIVGAFLAPGQGCPL